MVPGVFLALMHYVLVVFMAFRPLFLVLVGPRVRPRPFVYVSRFELPPVPIWFREAEFK